MPFTAMFWTRHHEMVKMAVGKMKMNFAIVELGVQD